MMNFSPFSITQSDYEQLNGLCSLNMYRVVTPDQIPIYLPKSLLDKSLKVIVIGSGDLLYSAYALNFLRIDENDLAIDQTPFMCAAKNDDSGIDLTGGFVHHGNWPERTIYPGLGFFQALEGSGLAKYYPIAGVPTKDFGSITELTPHSHRDAFWNGLRMLEGQL